MVVPVPGGGQAGPTSRERYVGMVVVWQVVCAGRWEEGGIGTRS